MPSVHFVTLDCLRDAAPVALLPMIADVLGAGCIIVATRPAFDVLGTIVADPDLTVPPAMAATPAFSTDIPGIPDGLYLGPEAEVRANIAAYKRLYFAGQRKGV